MIPDIQRALAYLTLLESEGDAALSASSNSAFSDPLKALQKPLKAARRVKPRPGQLWTTRPASRNPGVSCLVLLTRVRTKPWRALVATTEAWVATDTDIVVPGDQSPLGVALALCIDRDVPLHRDTLEFCLGAISDDALRATLMLLQHRLTSGFRLAAVEVVARQQVAGSEALATHLVRWKIRGKEGEEASWLSGPAVVDADDLRLPVKEALESATRYIETKALAADVVEDPAVESALERLRARLLDWVRLPDLAPSGFFALLTRDEPDAPMHDGVPEFASLRRIGFLTATSPFDVPARRRAAEDSHSVVFEMCLAGATVELTVSENHQALSLSARARDEQRTPVQGVVIHFGVCAPDDDGYRADIPVVERHTSKRGIIVPITCAVDDWHAFRIEVHFREERCVLVW